MAATSREFSNEFKDISQEQGNELTSAGQRYETGTKEYHHPDLYKYSADRPYDLPNLTPAWDGKQVWAVLDEETPMWRQATVLAVVPADPKGDHHSKWHFVLSTKHDSWRHVVSQIPTDENFLSFENIQVTEYALLPGADIPSTVYEAPGYFELLPSESPVLSVAKGATPVHPWIADELRAMRKLVDELKKENERLNKDLAASRAECEERRKSEERLAKLLQKEKDERKIAEDKLNRQIAALKEIERELNSKIVHLKDMINELQGEVNALSAKNELLSRENEALMSAVAELKSENEDLNVLVSGCQNALRASNKDKSELEEENRILRDRIQALDEALLKTMDSSNKSAHDTALKYAIEKAGMQAEIDRLRELLGSGVAPPQAVQQHVVPGNDDMELRKQLAMVSKELEDKSDLLTQSFEEIKRLKELLEIYSGIDWKQMYKDLKKLGERCGVLEVERGWKAGKIGSIEQADEEDEMAKYRIFDDDEERASKRKEKAERKKARNLARISSSLQGEVNGVDARIVELEKRLNAIPRAPPAEKVVPSTTPFLAVSSSQGFLKVNKSDWLSLQMQIQFLTGQKDPTKIITSSEMDILQQQVSHLLQRIEDLMAFVSGLPDGSPNYIPTFSRKLKGFFGNKYDGNFPWLLTRNALNLEKQNAELIKKVDLVTGRHVQQAEAAETLVQPIIAENNILREKVLKYKNKIDTLESAAAAAAAASSANLAAKDSNKVGGLLEIFTNGVQGAVDGVGSGFSEAGKSMGLAQ